jgi:hypothetical protein
MSVAGRFANCRLPIAESFVQCGAPQVGFGVHVGFVLRRGQFPTLFLLRPIEARQEVRFKLARPDYSGGTVVTVPDWAPGRAESSLPQTLPGHFGVIRSRSLFLRASFILLEGTAFNC